MLEVGMQSPTMSLSCQLRAAVLHRLTVSLNLHVSLLSTQSCGTSQINGNTKSPCLSDVNSELPC